MVSKHTYNKRSKVHGVLLDNDKWYKYYQVMKVNNRTKIRKSIKRISRNKEKYLMQRTLKREGLDLKNIIRKKRILRR